MTASALYMVFENQSEWTHSRHHRRSTSHLQDGAILQYLADKYDTDRKISYAPGTPESIKQSSWLFWQMTGLSPIRGILAILICTLTRFKYELDT